MARSVAENLVHLQEKQTYVEQLKQNLPEMIKEVTSNTFIFDDALSLVPCFINIF
jgi:hypothetical protein